MLLALDTATQMVGIALHDGAQILAEYVWRSARHHTVELAPETALTLRRLSLSPNALTAVAVALGPGSYTGLRIGLAFAKGLALAHNLPLIGIPTLDILARAQPPRSEPMLAVLQAGRGRIAGVWYKWSQGAWRAQQEAERYTWEEVLKALEEPTYIVGEVDPGGRKALRGVKLALVAEPTLNVRRTGFLAELAWEKLRAGAFSDPSILVPFYLKPRGETPP